MSSIQELPPATHRRDHSWDRSQQTGRSTVAAENAAWMRALATDGVGHEAGVAKLYRTLVKFGYTEARRHGSRVRLDGPELDDIVHQAAADATMTICRKVGTFRGECRFTTWAYRFVAYNVCSKINRHFWQHPSVNLDDNESVLPHAGAALRPEVQAEFGDLLRAVHRACAESLTDRQRIVFEAVVVKGTPIRQLAGELGSTPNALYKTIFDARRKLRAALRESGHLGVSAE